MAHGEIVPFPSVEEREKVRVDNEVREKMDSVTARALVDAGYMPLRRYIELYHVSPKSF